jgi:hypothetical protein
MFQKSLSLSHLLSRHARKTRRIRAPHVPKTLEFAPQEFHGQSSKIRHRSSPRLVVNRRLSNCCKPRVGHQRTGHPQAVDAHRPSAAKPDVCGVRSFELPKISPGSRPRWALPTAHPTTGAFPTCSFVSHRNRLQSPDFWPPGVFSLRGTSDRARFGVAGRPRAPSDRARDGAAHAASRPAYLR